jgi:GDPmannose 4,6-dehydratase
LIDDINVVEGDLTDQSSLDCVIHEVQPVEGYNMAAQSFVPASWNQAVLPRDATGLGVMQVLEALSDLDALQMNDNNLAGAALARPQ